jgi:lipopolysaccharide transport system permease protein
LAIPGFILVTLNVALGSISIGMASARFRDIPQLILSVVQIAFFMTPVMWKPELLGDRTYIVELNPFYHMIEVMRAPLLGKPFPIDSYIALGLITVLNLLVATLFFRRFRSRIAYWV